MVGPFEGTDAYKAWIGDSRFWGMASVWHPCEQSRIERGMDVLRRITDWLRGRRPLGYAVRYVEPDGTCEVDVKSSTPDAEAWADWCKRDGCTDVTIAPLYSNQELALAMHDQTSA